MQHAFTVDNKLELAYWIWDEVEAWQETSTENQQIFRKTNLINRKSANLQIKHFS